MKHRFWFLLLVPMLMAITAIILFVSQGGFGGGHGDFDRAIGLLGVPSILLVDRFPIHAPDILLIVLLPAALNFIVWAVVMFTFRFLLRGNQTI